MGSENSTQRSEERTETNTTTNNRRFRPPVPPQPTVNTTYSDRNNHGNSLYPNLPEMHRYNNNVQTESHQQPSSYNSYYQTNNQHQVFNTSNPIQPTAPPMLDLTARPVNVAYVNSNRRQYNQGVSCVTCHGPFGVDIYQCETGHSSCHVCKMASRNCGRCIKPILNVRNFALQNALRTPCNYADEGCTLHFTSSEMTAHVKECPFRDFSCPLKEFSGTTCTWIGKLAHFSHHFQIVHPENFQMTVNQEMVLRNILYGHEMLHFVEMNNNRFLVYIQVNVSEQRICMAVQFLGTKLSAMKWHYELQVYNKREPRRKFCSSNVCHPSGIKVADLFKESNCVVLPLQLALTYVNEGGITYKFFIKNAHALRPNNRFTKDKNGSNPQRNWHARAPSANRANV